MATRTSRSSAARTRKAATSKKATRVPGKQAVAAALKAVEREGQRLGKRLATRFKNIDKKKLIAAAAAAVGIGAAAVGALAARRKSRRRRRFRLR